MHRVGFSRDMRFVPLFFFSSSFQLSAARGGGGSLVVGLGEAMVVLASG